MTKEQEENDNLRRLLKYAIKMLEEINREELNSQRPGGSYSRSATLSYKALKTIRGEV